MMNDDDPTSLPTAIHSTTNDISWPMESKKSQEKDKKWGAVAGGCPESNNDKSTITRLANQANNTQPQPQPQQLFHAGKLEALQADVFILQALLRRNRCNHGRTKYYQRLAMALSAIRRHQALDLYTHFKALKRDVWATAQRKAAQRQRQIVFWEIQTSASRKNSNTEDDQEMQTLKQKMLAIRATLLALPSILQRLELAAAALWVEMARGFFLPFCVTAVAAVARIQWLLRQAGLWLLLPIVCSRGADAATCSASVTTAIIEEQQQDDQWSILERAWQSAHPEATTAAAAVETTNLLWPLRQRNELRDILLANKTMIPSAISSSVPLSTTRTSASGDYNSAKSICNSSSATTTDFMDDAHTSINDDSSDKTDEALIKKGAALVGQEDDDDDVAAAAAVDQDDDDTGVAVGGLSFMTRAATGEDLMSAAMEPSSRDDDDDDDDALQHHHQQEFDQNMDRVKEFQKSRLSAKKKKKNKRGGGSSDDDRNNDMMALEKKQRKRAAAAAAAAGYSDPESIDGKTKKKKLKESSKQSKKKKGNFFDELFGS
jgi:hypothetical protein